MSPWLWWGHASDLGPISASEEHTALIKLMSIESVMPSNHLILCRPLLFMPSIFPSIRVFSNKSALPIRWPKYWSFSFSISFSNEHSRLISFRMDWLDLLAVQGTLKITYSWCSFDLGVLHDQTYLGIRVQLFLYCRTFQRLQHVNTHYDSARGNTKKLSISKSSWTMEHF